MSRIEQTPTRQRNALVFGLAVGITLVVVGGLLLREHAPGNMGNGFLIGGLIAVVGLAAAAWRSLTRPATATTFERAFTQTGDERDDSVLTSALAVLGISTVPLTGIAAIVIALGLDPVMVMALLLFTQIGIAAAAFVIINRRG
jgi:hypothetical protein